MRCRRCQSQHTYTVNMSLINKTNLRNISSKQLTLLFFFSLPTPGEVVEDGLSCTVFPRLDRIIDSFWAFERRTIFKNSCNLVSSALSRWQTIAKEIFITEKNFKCPAYPFLHRLPSKSNGWFLLIIFSLQTHVAAEVRFVVVFPPRFMFLFRFITFYCVRI